MYYGTTETVEGKNGTSITGKVTDVTCTGQIWEVTDGNDVYERSKVNGLYYLKK